jgi:hypothetical protein
MFTFPKKPEFEVSIQDSVWVEDPLGYGLGFEILRSDHELARKWDEAHPESTMAKLQTVGLISQAVGAQRNVELISGLANKLEGDGVHLLQADMELSKRKLACCLLRKWRGVAVDGVDVDFEPQIALNLLGFRGIGYRDGQNAPWEYLTSAEWTRLEKRGTNLSRRIATVIGGKPVKDLTVVEFAGEHRDESGAVRVVPMTIPELSAEGEIVRKEDGTKKMVAVKNGGNPFGTWLAFFLLDESLNASAVLAKQGAEDQESFGGSPDTALGSGDSQPSSANSSKKRPKKESSAASTTSA